MKQSTTVGVDISKVTFDANWLNEGKAVDGCFANDQVKFSAFLEWMPDDAHVVMEATGTYYLKLATYLYDHGIKVSVINPLSSAYFARMKLKRAKSDPLDAVTLREYGDYEEVPLWRPADKVLIELNQLDSHLSGLTKDLTRVTNRIEGLSQCVTINEFAMSDLVAQKSDLKIRIKQCEKVIAGLVHEHFADLYQLLVSIKGIGAKTAVMFIVLTNAFTSFPSAKKFVSFLGMSSFTEQSGTSVKGSGSITKMGSSRMRQLLYMAALTAKHQNKACKEFAARLAANGKPKKVIRIAVANKLIRQVFAVCEKQEPYCESFA